MNAVEPKIWIKPGNKSFASAFPGDISKSLYMNSASGSQGIAMFQTTTNGSIGYNEISYARGLKTVSVQNKAGYFMQPTVSAASVFLKDFTSEDQTNTTTYHTGTAADIPSPETRGHDPSAA